MCNLPNTRRDAQRCNERFYFTGKPCKHGHMAKRYSLSGNCVQCDKTVHVATRKKYYEELDSETKAAYAARSQPKSIVKQKQKDKKTRAAAFNSRCTWTIEHIRIATEKDETGDYVLPVLVACELLGRSRKSIERIRARCSN